MAPAVKPVVQISKPVVTEEEPPVVASPTMERRGSSQQQPTVKKLLSTTATEDSNQETAASLASGKRRGKLGVKKVSVKFDEMEEKAKQEAGRLAELERQGLLDQQAEERKKQEEIQRRQQQHSAALSSSSSVVKTKSEAPAPARPGFGAIAGAPSAPKSSSSIANSYQPEETGARSKFASAKAISSDMYFERGAHAPSDPEALSRLQQFSGQKSISSAQFYGQEEDPARPGSSVDVREFTGAADALVKDFAKTFVSEAKADLENVKQFAMTGASKLQDFLRDVSQSSGRY